jgi:hypothetical protein
MAYAALVCAFANGFFVFLWGSRSVLVIVGATLILGLRRRRPRRSVAERQRVALRLGLAALWPAARASLATP